ncbi:MAG: type IX secretion system membrane protein PorP/SprF [Cyclobacteriaceae bacterium]
MANRLKLLVIGLIATTCCFELIAQQKPIVSTYMFNPLPLNPAMAGRLNQLSITVMNRDQWVNIDGAPSLQTLTAENSFRSNQIGAGLMLTNDQVGIHKEVSLYTAYAYKIPMRRGVVSMGLQGGFNSRRSDFTQLNVRDENDNLLSGSPRTFNPNFGTGIYYQDTKSYIGISVPYILSPKAFDVNLDTGEASESREVRYYYMYAGTAIGLSGSYHDSQILFNPSVLAKIPERGPISFDINAMIIFREKQSSVYTNRERVYAGISWRFDDSVIALVQFVLNDNFRVGYAYDAVTSALTRYSNGSHEIMLNYRIPIKNHKKNPDCPTFI